MIFTGLLSFAQETPAPAQSQGNFITALLPFILVFVIFYLLIIMPSRKKQKRHQDMVGALKPGDKIVTTGGVYGTIMGVKEDRLEVKIAANVKIEITKNSIGAILSPKKEGK